MLSRGRKRGTRIESRRVGFPSIGPVPPSLPPSQRSLPPPSSSTTPPSLALPSECVLRPGLLTLPARQESHLTKTCLPFSSHFRAWPSETLTRPLARPRRRTGHTETVSTTDLGASRVYHAATGADISAAGIVLVFIIAFLLVAMALYFSIAKSMKKRKARSDAAKQRAGA